MYELVEELYRAHTAELTAALALSLNDRAAAEDIAQEVFVRAMDHEDALRIHPDPRAWLFRTGYNLSANRWRLLTRRRHKLRQIRPVLAVEAWEDTLELREALEQLSRRQRDAVVLHYYLGFSPSEIAEMLGCAEGSVRSHIQRGRVTLQRLLGTVGAAGEG